ncbi:MAG: hypothetical protein WC358_02015 [Ignavibacteria bacterium]|jgi:hypothetical protein
MASSGKRVSKERFDKAAEDTVTSEIATLEKRILSDLAEMIGDAHTLLAESKVFDRFKSHLKGRTPGLADLNYLKRLIEIAVEEHNKAFLKYFEVVVERDPRNKSLVGYEFKVKPELFR